MAKIQLCCVTCTWRGNDGQCRKSPPPWHKVKKSDWCGEYEMRPAIKEADFLDMTPEEFLGFDEGSPIQHLWGGGYVNTMQDVLKLPLKEWESMVESPDCAVTGFLQNRVEIALSRVGRLRLGSLSTEDE